MSQLRIFLFIFIALGCREDGRREYVQDDVMADSIPTADKNPAGHMQSMDKWVELTASDGFVLDLKYAGSDNFTREQIYGCGRCYLRPEPAAALLLLKEELWRNHRLRIKLFDCYRPGPAQSKLWNIVPNAAYVTPPQKGSMHTRGMAVDLTLVDEYGKELDMGTDFDFFGITAHTDYTGHPEPIPSNRKILADAMIRQGFIPIRTEWWHYSMPTPTYELSDWEWPCD